MKTINFKKGPACRQAGQAMITLLFVMSIVLFMVLQTVVLDLGNIDLTNESSQGSLLVTKAEGYLENSALLFLRNPNYTGENLQDEDISCTMQIVDINNAKEITAACQQEQRIRKVGMTVAISGGVYTFSKIEEKE